MPVDLCDDQEARSLIADLMGRGEKLRGTAAGRPPYWAKKIVLLYLYSTSVDGVIPNKSTKHEKFLLW